MTNIITLSGPKEYIFIVGVVNLSNVLDEGVRIRRAGRWMNSKVKIGQTRQNLQYY
jgi:hypothetical protein